MALYGFGMLTAVMLAMLTLAPLGQRDACWTPLEALWTHQHYCQVRNLCLMFARDPNCNRRGVQSEICDDPNFCTNFLSAKVTEYTRRRNVMLTTCPNFVQRTFCEVEP